MATFDEVIEHALDTTTDPIPPVVVRRGGQDYRFSFTTREDGDLDLHVAHLNEKGYPIPGSALTDEDEQATDWELPA